MPYVSKEQLTAAREVDLLTYLRCFEPQELVHISGSTYAYCIRKLNLRCRPNTPIIGVFLHIYAAAALTPRSSTTASSTGSSMRMLSAITAYLLALQRGSLPMPCCGERSGKSGLSVK